MEAQHAGVVHHAYRALPQPAALLLAARVPAALPKAKAKDQPKASAKAKVMPKAKAKAAPRARGQRQAFGVPNRRAANTPGEYLEFLETQRRHPHELHVNVTNKKSLVKHIANFLLLKTEDQRKYWTDILFRYTTTGIMRGVHTYSNESSPFNS